MGEKDLQFLAGTNHGDKFSREQGQPWRTLCKYLKRLIEWNSLVSLFSKKFEPVPPFYIPFNMVWRWVSGPPSTLCPPVIQGFPISVSQYYIWSPETVVMVRWTRDTFEFDQPYKTRGRQNAGNREDFKQYVRLSLCNCENA